jgi:hypothetical protein
MAGSAQQPERRCADPSVASYKWRRCRCAGCYEANRTYERRRNRLLAYGRWQPYVDAEPVRRHVRGLMAAGMGWQHIARMAGVPGGSLSKLLYGQGARPPSRRIRPGTAARLLAVRPTLQTLAAGARVDPTGTRRRMQAMAAVGWPLGEQARRLGRGLSNYSKTLDSRWCTAGTARAVAGLYEQLSMVPGPSGRSRQRAGSLGWAPPLAWDDIDDPACRPKLGSGSRRLRPLTVAERRAVVHRMWRDGTRDAVVAERLGVKVGSVRALRYRHGWTRRQRAGVG